MTRCRSPPTTTTPSRTRPSIVSAAADDDGGVGDLFVALDADVLAEGDAGAGQPIGGGVRGLCATRER